jgi:DNA-binding SARP family transcriptional activator
MTVATIAFGQKDLAVTRSACRSLERLYAEVLRRLIAEVDPQEPAVFLEKLLAVEPAEETAHRALVLSYIAQGRCDLARQRVARWPDISSEPSLEPPPEAKALWRMVEDEASER